jgi:tetratricopeptide (TPR) repeat protein
VLAGFSVALASLICTARADAAPQDAATTVLVTQVLSEEYAQASFGEAKRKLLGALATCDKKKNACSPPVRGRVHVVLGMVHSQLGQADEAKSQFVRALQVDGNAKLPQTTTPNIRNQWKEAQESLGKGKADEEGAAGAVAVGGAAGAAAAAAGAQDTSAAETPTGPGTSALAQAAPSSGAPAAGGPVTAAVSAGIDPATEGAAPVPAGAVGRAIPGWSNTDAYLAAMAALAAGTAGKYDECIAKDRESVELEDKPRTRLHLASCQAKAGKLIDALRDASKALDMGVKAKDAAVIRVSRTMIQDLVQRIPHVTFVPPANAEELQVTFDDRAVPVESLTKKFSVDPGKHTVKAEGTISGIPMTFEREYDIKPGELLTVAIQLQAAPSQYLTPGQLRCMLQAKTQEEVNKCLPQKAKSLVARASLEMGGYTDTTAVQVISPRFAGSVTSPTAGWNVGASYLLDVYTAASPDIVSYGSPRYYETRNAGGFSAGYKPGLYGGTVTANVSREPDYISLGVGGAVTADLFDKLVTPRLSYNYSADTAGFKTTPFEIYSRFLASHAIEAGVTFVLSPTLVLFTNASLNFERGEQSKPYRFMPFFDPSVAPRVPVGASIDLVNANRLPVRPQEQLPTSRDRYALAARIAKRFSASTLRVEERLYYDTWATIATTTDARWIFDVGKKLRVWPHARLHVQSGTNFWRRAYAAEFDVDANTWRLPLYRTGDRELSPMMTVTGGGGSRFAITPPEAHTQLGLIAQLDLMYSRFFDSIFVTQRFGTYASVTLEAEFE